MASTCLEDYLGSRGRRLSILRRLGLERATCWWAGLRVMVASLISRSREEIMDPMPNQDDFVDDLLPPHAWRWRVSQKSTDHGLGCADKPILWIDGREIGPTSKVWGRKKLSGNYWSWSKQISVKGMPFLVSLYQRSRRSRSGLK